MCNLVLYVVSPGESKYDITWSLTWVCSGDKRLLIHLSQQSEHSDERQGNTYQQGSDLKVFSSYCSTCLFI